ncbi:OprO/OprP family phosphate-selective porin [Singulisphaera sp. GP187]|uniref:OprO/OprP family phosphate-selective porin n=1 Tax=Singulisphaera sp. GP187 TaxID=1882752 RepID=UPI0020B16BB2|nr:porin [Singulisphaera sp. GP187]
MNRKLADELATTRREQKEQIQQLLERFGAVPASASDRTTEAGRDSRAVDEPAPPNEAVEAANMDSPVPDYTEGQFNPSTLPPGTPPAPSSRSKRSPLLGSFGPGFRFQTEDEKFRLQVHYESQIEARIWGQSDQDPTNSGFFLPRQRIFFDGNITKSIEYELSINRGLNNINLLNAYINLHFNDRFQFKFGRFFTPLPYDQFAISNYWLLTPERSIFTTNLGLNRQIGMMGWGYLFDKRVDYAAGIFNGSRNSFESLHNGVDFVGYFNARPFQESEGLPWFKFLNLGTSVAYGFQDQSPVPRTFRIGGGSPDANIPGTATVPFLTLNPNVVEQGERLLGSVHSAYFYKGLSLIGEWQYGYGNYSTPGRRSSTQVPFSGFYVAGGYFLTGEHIERRTRLRPLRPLVPTNKGEHRGLGAIELAGRVSELRLGEQIFTAGFANPDLWSNQVITTELGVNWYWNEYIKVYAFWLHGEFADPVQFRPGRLQDTADMFWLRFQLYF